MLTQLQGEECTSSVAPTSSTPKPLSQSLTPGRRSARVYKGSQSGRSGGYASARYCTSPAHPTTMFSTIAFHSSAPAKHPHSRPQSASARHHSNSLVPIPPSCRSNQAPPECSWVVTSLHSAPLCRSGRGMVVAARTRDSTGTTILDSPGSSTCSTCPLSKAHTMCIECKVLKTGAIQYESIQMCRP